MMMSLFTVQRYGAFLNYTRPKTDEIAFLSILIMVSYTENCK